MASFSWARWGHAIAGTLLGLCACQKDTGSFGPPEGAGGLDVGGAGGSATTVTSGGGAAPTPNFCECTYEIVSDKGCGDCVNATTNVATGDCYDALAKCKAEPECEKLISTCPYTCKDLAPAKRAECVSACLLPFGGDAAHDLAAAFLTCACEPCAKACGGSPAIACQ